MPLSRTVTSEYNSQSIFFVFTHRVLQIRTAKPSQTDYRPYNSKLSLFLHGFNFDFKFPQKLHSKPIASQTSQISEDLQLPVHFGRGWFRSFRSRINQMGEYETKCFEIAPGQKLAFISVSCYNNIGLSNEIEVYPNRKILAYWQSLHVLEKYFFMG